MSVSALGASGSPSCLINEAADAARVAIAISAEVARLNQLTHCAESQFHCATPVFVLRLHVCLLCVL